MLKRREPLTYDNALSRAAALCAKCEQCSPDITKKLLAWGLTPSDAAKIISRLEELSFLDDERFVKAYAHDKLHFGGWGRNKIKQGLWAKRLRRDLIDSACDEINPEEYKFIALKVIRAKARSFKQYPLSREDKLKIVKFAMQRGFEYPIVADVMRHNTYQPNQDDEIQ